MTELGQRDVISEYFNDRFREYTGGLVEVPGLTSTSNGFEIEEKRDYGESLPVQESSGDQTTPLREVTRDKSTISLRSRRTLPRFVALAAASLSLSMLTACVGPFAPQPRPEQEAVVQIVTPTVTPNPTETPILVPRAEEVQPEPEYDPGRVLSIVGQAYKATGEQKYGIENFDPHNGEELAQFEDKKTNDPDFNQTITKYVQEVQDSYPDEGYYVPAPKESEHYEKNLRMDVVEKVAGDEFKWPQIKSEPAAVSEPDAIPTPSVPSGERLPGGLRPWYIKSATDGDPKTLGNYTKSLETNPALKEFNQREGRKSIEEIGITTFANSARFIFNHVPGVSLQALEQAFKLGEYRIAYKNTAGKIEFTKVVVVKGQTNESLHQISADEEVLAFKIIYQNGREAIRLLRIMCIQEFDVEVPVAKVIPTTIPAGAPPALVSTRPIPTATLRPPVGSIPTATLRPPVAQERIVPPTPAAPVTYEQLPSPVREFVRTLPPGQQVVIKLFDTNNNGICEPGDLPPQNVQGVVFAIESLSPERRVVYTNHLGIAIGDFRPNGEPFRVIEFVRPGERILYAQPEGRAGAMPAVFCNGREINLALTATSTSTSTPSPTPSPTLRPGETATVTSTATGTATVGPSPTGTPTPTPGETRTGTSTPTAVPTAERTATTPPAFTATFTVTASPFVSFTSTATPEPSSIQTQTATGTPTIRPTATFQTTSSTATVRPIATFSRL